MSITNPIPLVCFPSSEKIDAYLSQLHLCNLPPALDTRVAGMVADAFDNLTIPLPNIKNKVIKTLNDFNKQLETKIPNKLVLQLSLQFAAALTDFTRG